MTVTRLISLSSTWPIECATVALANNRPLYSAYSLIRLGLGGGGGVAVNGAFF